MQWGRARPDDVDCFTAFAREIVKGSTDRYEAFTSGLNEIPGTQITAGMQERKTGLTPDLPNRETERAKRLWGKDYHWLNRFVETAD